MTTIDPTHNTTPFPEILEIENHGGSSVESAAAGGNAEAAAHEPTEMAADMAATSATGEASVNVTVVATGGAADATEISLADQYVTPVAVDVAAPPLEEQLSLPAALCDDRLLEEINTIPDKMGFKIGEVADMLGIKQYVLRYWESEFDILKPKKASNNQRYYTKKDVENAYLIRKLLHRDRFSIEGARAAMKDLKSFVRSEVKKEKVITTMSQKIDHVQDQIDDLLIHIRRTKLLF